MQPVFYALLFLTGACMGSFLCCQARRLHLRQGKKRRKLNSRSICLHCHKQLRWYDNIPIISWLVLRGKCRYCHRPIGLAEFLSELGTAIAFLLLGFTIDPPTVTVLEWMTFVTVLVFTCILVFLAIYDGLYGELPTLFLGLAILLGLIIFALNIAYAHSAARFTPSLITDTLLSVLILGGLYLLLYLLSKGKWVGDGDWLLATAIALVLGHPFLALTALFLANFTACLVMLPMAKGNPRAKIHFGPFLVIAFVIIYSFSSFLMTVML